MDIHFFYSNARNYIIISVNHKIHHILNNVEEYYNIPFIFKQTNEISNYWNSMQYHLIYNFKLIILYIWLYSFYNILLHHLQLSYVHILIALVLSLDHRHSFFVNLYNIINFLMAILLSIVGLYPVLKLFLPSEGKSYVLLRLCYSHIT
jgi:hypothetical protein